MRYISTRGGGGLVSFSDALLAGLAPDGGLYVPELYPQLSRRTVETMRGMSYNHIAVWILKLFVGDDIKESDLEEIVTTSYTARKFGSLDITPIQPISPGASLLKLSNGPTLAFKDVGLQLLANLMEHVLRERDAYLNILGATSGDTGSAAEEAVRGMDRLRICMLSPFGRMTPFQERQMYTIDDPRVFNLVTNGAFDDCQAAVKLVNEDADFKRQYSIGAVNSINWARIVAQVVYYVYGYTRVIQHRDDFLTVAIPSGNFGNALAAYVAGKMGLRIRIIVATNDNDVLTEFFKTGVYRVRKGAEVKKTFSPSMDIASASNFERFMFDYVDRDPEKLKALWLDVATTGQFTFSHNFSTQNNEVRIYSSSATDAQVIETIRLVFKLYGIIIDPHTAVAMKAGFDLHPDSSLGPILYAETAQPAKFEDTIQKAIGHTFAASAASRDMYDKPQKITRIEESDPSAIAKKVKSFIEANIPLT